MTEERQDKPKAGGWIVCALLLLFLLYIVTPGFVLGLYVRHSKGGEVAEWIAIPYAPVLVVSRHLRFYSNFLRWQFLLVSDPHSRR